MKIILLLLSFYLLNFYCSAQFEEYVPGLIVVKIDESAARSAKQNTISIDRLKQEGLTQKIKPLYEFGSGNYQSRNVRSRLNGLYKIDLNHTVDEIEYVRYLNSFSNVIYAERYPNVQPLLVPNDPEAQIGKAQFHLDQIKAYQAWDITKGSKDMVIGIIDTGADLFHEDLAGNIYLNEDDPIDGLDNDGDGYIDNYYGWDFADNDNFPEADGDPHGSGVSGIAAADTDNGIGIAGIGFNTRFMPIKIFKTENNFSRNSYEAIIYAADMGCDVINLSWGNSGRYSQFAQDIINYAALERDVVIVAAAGNTNAELDFFPASYDHVLSVGFVNADDSKNVNATYSDFIDMVAPGIGIYTTENNDGYGNDSGSSYAAPMVAGAAALVRHIFPDWSALQVMEQLRVSTENIDDVGNNADFQYKFGKGRLNVFRALADFDKPSVRISNLKYSNGLEQAAYFGDTLAITIELTNYLFAAQNVKVELTAESPYVEIIQNSFTISNLNTLEKVANESQQFIAVLSEDLPENQTINFRLLMEGDFYSDYQSFQIQSSPKITIYNFDQWQFGFTATGNMGRSTETPFSNYNVKYKGMPLLDHLGVFAAVTADSISKNTLINPTNFQYAEDFETLTRLKRYSDITAEFDIRSVFKEQDTLSNALGISIEQRVLAWAANSGILLQKYRIQNRSNEDYDSLYFGLFVDPAIGDKLKNKIHYDSLHQLLYGYEQNNGQYFGLAKISQQDSIFYAFDLANESGNTSDLDQNSLTDSILWDALKNPFKKITAGGINQGNDVGGIAAVQFTVFPAQTTQEIDYAILSASSLDSLILLLGRAKELNELVKQRPAFGRQIFICKDDSPIIKPHISESTLKIFTSMESDSILYKGDQFEPGIIGSDTVFYYRSIDSLGFESITRRLVISISRPKADFVVPETPFLIDPESTNSYRFIDQSSEAVKWNWTIDNGFSSGQQNPNITFTEAGSYQVQLLIENKLGCKDTVQKEFIVALRSIKPNINRQEICKFDQLTLRDENLAEIVVYSEPELVTEIFRGVSFLTDPIDTDTVFYIRNEQGNYPSLVTEVAINLIPLQAKMEVKLDLNAGESVMQGIAKSSSLFATDLLWLMGTDTLGITTEITFELNDLKENELKLIAKSASACTDTTIFQPSVSDRPIFDAYYLCQSSGVNISASNSDAIYYYADAELTDFLGKGNKLSIEEVTENMMIYAVNVENFIPSEVVEVPIYVSDLNADFQASADTINLAFENEIQLVSNAASAIKWHWTINGETIGNTQEINVIFSKSGKYLIDLQVKDSLACVVQSSQEITVFDDPILGNAEQLKAYFSIYPNPANKIIYITGKDNFKVDSYRIMDTQGREISTIQANRHQQSLETIDVADLAPGAYYLMVRKNKVEISFLFIIKR